MFVEHWKNYVLLVLRSSGVYNVSYRSQQKSNIIALLAVTVTA